MATIGNGGGAEVDITPGGTLTAQNQAHYMFGAGTSHGLAKQSFVNPTGGTPSNGYTPTNNGFATKQPDYHQGSELQWGKTGSNI